MKTLREVKIGETVKVVKLHGEGPVKRRIMDMGITKGVEVYVRKVAPLGDPMEVTVWDPPRRLRVEKRGRVLAGWADISLTSLPQGGTRVTWQEEVVPAHAGTARRARPLFDAAGKVVFRRALSRMLRAGS